MWVPQKTGAIARAVLLTLSDQCLCGPRPPRATPANEDEIAVLGSNRTGRYVAIQRALAMSIPRYLEIVARSGGVEPFSYPRHHCRVLRI